MPRLGGGRRAASADGLTFVTCPGATGWCNIERRMSSTAAMQTGPRGSRVKLGGSILALLVLENGRQIRGRMNQLSLNGGLVSLEHPLDEGIRVTVLFHLGFSVRCRAQMLFPMWATQGCLQPFRFLELSEASRAGLNLELESLVRAGALQEEEAE